MKHLVIGALLLWAATCPLPAWGWTQGRATYFDAPNYWKEAFPIVNQFGDLFGGTCGYVDRFAGVMPSNEHVSFPLDAVAGITDVSRDHIGGCGRCYEVRCTSGPVLQEAGIPYNINEIFYLPRSAPPGLKDPEGREWPGVPDTIDPSVMYTQCRDETTTVVVTIIDSCPCVYIGGRVQDLCCGPIEHFDLSFWAFNKLAHPLYGRMMLEYRPVDCKTHEPLDTPNPVISRTIYDDRPGTGWGWRAYYEKSSVLIDLGQGRRGSPATCARLTPGGGMAFWCRGCEADWAQPFNAASIQFWIRSNADEKTPSHTPKGEVPQMGMFLSQAHEPIYTAAGTTQEPEIFCYDKPNLGNYTPLRQDGDWYEFNVPLDDFRCHGELSTAAANRIVFANPGVGDEGDAVFCLDDIRIL